MVRKLLFTIIICAVIGLIIPYLVSAQSIYESWFPSHSITLESFTPNFNNEPHHIKGSTTFFNLSWPINNRVRFVSDMPFLYIRHTHQDSLRSSASGWTYGNPYIGLEIRKPLSLFYFEAGIRLPLEPHALTGSTLVPHYSDLSRWSSLNYRTGSLQALINFHYENVSGWAIRLIGGPQLALVNNMQKARLFFKYSGELRLKIYPLTLGSGIEGLFNISHSPKPENLINYYIESSFRMGSVEPGAVISFPYDTVTKEIIHYVVGIRMRIFLEYL